jgi:hypothetical protein
VAEVRDDFSVCRCIDLYCLAAKFSRGGGWGGAKPPDGWSALVLTSRVPGGTDPSWRTLSLLGLTYPMSEGS